MRPAPRAWACTLLLLLAGTPAGHAADPVSYTAVLTPTGDKALDGVLASASTLQTLKDAPAGPFALITRVREDKGRLQAALNSQGYYDGKAAARIQGRDVDDPELPDLLDQLPQGQAATIEETARPGPRFTLRRVELRGTVPARAQEALALAPGAPAIATDVLAAQDRMLQALRRDGYALAKVATPDAVLITAEHALDVAYTVTPGPRVDLGPIAVNGLVRTDAGFVRRRLLVRQGEQFDPDKIEKARRDLTDLGVFATVRASTADSLDAGGQLPLAFDVTERARHAVGLTGSYSTDLGATAGATFELRNVFGQAELLRLGAAVTQLGGSASRSPGYDVTASLTKPDVFTRDQSVTGTLRAVKEDLDAYDRTAFIAGLSGTRKLSDHWSVSAGLLGTQSKVTQEAVTRDYTLLGLPLGAIYNTVPTDQLLEPISGVKAVLTVTPTANLGGAGGGDGGREQGGSSFTLIQLAGSTYLDLPWLGGAPGRSVLAARALVGSAQGASTFQLPPDQRFYAGGGGTVRGYKYQSIGPRFASNRPVGGTSVTAGSIEFRQRFLSSFGVAAFIDAGQVGTSSAPFSGDLKVGAGLGARYYTPIGPIRLDVALPLNKERGDDAFELYIGIGQAF